MRSKKSYGECQCEYIKLGDWSSWKEYYIQKPSLCDFEWNETYKIDKFLDIKTFSCAKHLFAASILACEDEISNTVGTWLVEKKITYEKNQLPYSHYFPNNYLLIIISCHFY